MSHKKFRYRPEPFPHDRDGPYVSDQFRSDLAPKRGICRQCDEGVPFSAWSLEKLKAPSFMPIFHANGRVCNDGLYLWQLQQPVGGAHLEGKAE